MKTKIEKIKAKIQFLERQAERVSEGRGYHFLLGTVDDYVFTGWEGGTE